MKKNINKSMNETKSILDNLFNMSHDEIEMALSIVMDGVVDKDAISEPKFEDNFGFSYVGVIDPVWEAELAHIEFQENKSRKFSKSKTIRDKARHGYHGGSRKEGWGDYDKWLLPEREKKDIKKDIRNQMVGYYNPATETPVDDGICTLRMVYSDILEDFSLGIVYNHSVTWYRDYTKRFDRVDQEKDFVLSKIYAYQESFYNTLDSIYPEEGLGWKKEVVSAFVEALVTSVEEKEKTMKRHILDMARYSILQELEDIEYKKEELNK